MIKGEYISAPNTTNSVDEKQYLSTSNGIVTPDMVDYCNQEGNNMSSQKDGTIQDYLASNGHLQDDQSNGFGCGLSGKVAGIIPGRQAVDQSYFDTSSATISKDFSSTEIPMPHKNFMKQQIQKANFAEILSDTKNLDADEGPIQKRIDSHQSPRTFEIQMETKPNKFEIVDENNNDDEVLTAEDDQNSAEAENVAQASEMEEERKYATLLKELSKLNQMGNNSTASQENNQESSIGVVKEDGVRISTIKMKDAKSSVGNQSKDGHQILGNLQRMRIEELGLAPHMLESIYNQESMTLDSPQKFDKKTRIFDAKNLNQGRNDSRQISQQSRSKQASKQSSIERKFEAYRDERLSRQSSKQVQKSPIRILHQDSQRSHEQSASEKDSKLKRAQNSDRMVPSQTSTISFDEFSAAGRLLGYYHRARKQQQKIQEEQQLIEAKENEQKRLARERLLRNSRSHSRNQQTSAERCKNLNESQNGRENHHYASNSRLEENRQYGSRSRDSRFEDHYSSNAEIKKSSGLKQSHRQFVMLNQQAKDFKEEERRKWLRDSRSRDQLQTFDDAQKASQTLENFGATQQSRNESQKEARSELKPKEGSKAVKHLYGLNRAKQRAIESRQIMDRVKDEFSQIQKQRQREQEVLSLESSKQKCMSTMKSLQNFGVSGSFGANNNPVLARQNFENQGPQQYSQPTLATINAQSSFQLQVGLISPTNCPRTTTNAENVQREFPLEQKQNSPYYKYPVQQSGSGRIVPQGPPILKSSSRSPTSRQKQSSPQIYQPQERPQIVDVQSKQKNHLAKLTDRFQDELVKRNSQSPSQKPQNERQTLRNFAMKKENRRQLSSCSNSGQEESAFEEHYEDLKVGSIEPENHPAINYKNDYEIRTQMRALVPSESYPNNQKPQQNLNSDLAPIRESHIEPYQPSANTNSNTVQSQASLLAYVHQLENKIGDLENKFSRFDQNQIREAQSKIVSPQRAAEFPIEATFRGSYGNNQVSSPSRHDSLLVRDHMRRVASEEHASQISQKSQRSQKSHNSQNQNSRLERLMRERNSSCSKEDVAEWQEGLDYQPKDRFEGQNVRRDFHVGSGRQNSCETRLSQRQSRLKRALSNQEISTTTARQRSPSYHNLRQNSRNRNISRQRSSGSLSQYTSHKEQIRKNYINKIESLQRHNDNLLRDNGILAHRNKILNHQVTSLRSKTDKEVEQLKGQLKAVQKERDEMKRKFIQSKGELNKVRHMNSTSENIRKNQAALIALQKDKIIKLRRSLEEARDVTGERYERVTTGSQYSNNKRRRSRSGGGSRSISNPRNKRSDSQKVSRQKQNHGGKRNQSANATSHFGKVQKMGLKRDVDRHFYHAEKSREEEASVERLKKSCLVTLSDNLATMSRQQQQVQPSEQTTQMVWSPSPLRAPEAIVSQQVDRSNNGGRRQYRASDYIHTRGNSEDQQQMQAVRLRGGDQPQSLVETGEEEDTLNSPCLACQEEKLFKVNEIVECSEEASFEDQSKHDHRLEPEVVTDQNRTLQHRHSHELDDNVPTSDYTQQKIHRHHPSELVAQKLGLQNQTSQKHLSSGKQTLSQNRLSYVKSSNYIISESNLPQNANISETRLPKVVDNRDQELRESLPLTARQITTTPSQCAESAQLRRKEASLNRHNEPSDTHQRASFEQIRTVSANSQQSRSRSRAELTPLAPSNTTGMTSSHSAFSPINGKIDKRQVAQQQQQQHPQARLASAILQPKIQKNLTSSNLRIKKKPHVDKITRNGPNVQSLITPQSNQTGISMTSSGKRRVFDMRMRERVAKASKKSLGSGLTATQSSQQINGATKPSHHLRKL